MACISLAFLLALSPWAANASTQLALDHGCYSCHGAYLREEAPNFKGLAQRLSRYKGELTTQQQFVDKFLVGEMFGHIDAHERLSAESAKVLVHWLAEGGQPLP